MNHPTTLDVGLAALMADARRSAEHMEARRAQLPPAETDERPPPGTGRDDIGKKLFVDELYMMRTMR